MKTMQARRPLANPTSQEKQQVARVTAAVFTTAERALQAYRTKVMQTLLTMKSHVAFDNITLKSIDELLGMQEGD